MRLAFAALVLPALALAQADPTPAKTPTRLEKLLATPSPSPSPAAKSTKRLESLLLEEKRPEICASIDKLVAARKDGFASIKTNDKKVPILGKTWESSVTPKGAMGKCDILPGATGAFVTCDMSAPMSKADAEREYAALLATVKKCFPGDEGQANDDSETGERATDFGSDKTGYLGAVQVGMSVDGITHETCQVELRFHE